MSPPILLEIRDAVAYVTLNRPEQANVLNDEMSAAFIETVETLARACGQGQVSAALLSAKGPHFCAGGDISGFVASDDLAGLMDRGIPPLHRAIHTLSTLPVPVVSAVNGSLGGGGIGVALCADLVLASSSMKLRGGYSAIGLSPDVGVSWALTRLAGPMRAKHILFTNEPLTAQQCLSAGLVLDVYDDDQLMPAAEKLVRSLAAGATGALGRIKTLVDQAARHSLRDQLEREHYAMVVSGAGREAGEGVRAFMEKRPPRFKQTR